MNITPYKTEYGLYPAMPGFKVAIGDYGVWKGHEWCPLGNIYETYGPISFNVKEEEVSRDETCDVGVSMSAGVGADINAPAVDARTVLDFGAVGGLHYRAHIVKVTRFASVQNEVYTFMKKYLDLGIWEPKLWLAVEVCEADDLLSIQSKAKGVKVEINGGSSDELKLAKMNFESHFKYDRASVSSLHFSDVRQFAGARFVSFTRTGIFRNRLIPGYQGATIDFETASEQVVY